MVAVQSQRELYSALKNADNECRYSARTRCLIRDASKNTIKSAQNRRRSARAQARPGQGPVVESADRSMLTN